MLVMRQSGENENYQKGGKRDVEIPNQINLLLPGGMCI